MGALKFPEGVKDVSHLFDKYPGNVEKCPFCKSSGDQLSIIEANEEYNVVCNNCLCSGPVSGRSTVAIFLWNEGTNTEMSEPYNDYAINVELMEYVDSLLSDAGGVIDED